MVVPLSWKILWVKWVALHDYVGWPGTDPNGSLQLFLGWKKWCQIQSAYYYIHISLGGGFGHFWFYCYLGKWSNLTIQYFSNGLKPSPSSLCMGLIKGYHFLAISANVTWNPNELVFGSKHLWSPLPGEMIQFDYIVFFKWVWTPTSETWVVFQFPFRVWESRWTKSCTIWDMFCNDLATSKWCRSTSPKNRSVWFV